MQVPNLQECVPRKWGSRGWADYERKHRRSARRKRTPWRVFGYFLRVQKVTSVSLGDRRSPLRYIRPN